MPSAIHLFKKHMHSAVKNHGNGLFLKLINTFRYKSPCCCFSFFVNHFSRKTFAYLSKISSEKG